MKQVTDTYLAKMEDTLRTYIPRLTIDGVELDGELQTGMTINFGSCGSEAFSIGSVFIPSISASIFECSTKLQDKELFLEMGLVLDDETVEYTPMGYFTVEKPYTKKELTTFTAYGRLMGRGGFLYVSTLSYPAPLQDVINELSDTMGITITLNGLTADGLLNKPIKGELCRDALGYIAGLLGGFVTEDSTGNIVISKYSLNQAIAIDTELCYEFPESNDDAYTVTGVEIIVTEDGEAEDGSTVEGEKYASGTAANVVVSNPYMNESLFESCEANIVGFSYLPTKVRFLGDIRLEPWDSIIVTDDEEVIEVPCMDISHVWDGGLVTTITAPGNTAAEQDGSFSGPIAKAVEKTYMELLLVKQVVATKVTADEIEAKMADIGYVKTDEIEAKLAGFGYVTADEIDAKYVNIDKTNIDEAWITDLLVKGNFLAEDVNAATGSFSHYLTGVNIYGDIITAGTITADRLIIRDTESDKGLLFALNDGVVDQTALSEEQLKRLTLNGQVITAESITADKINVTDLFAQDIVATGSITGVELKGATGTFTGEISAQSGTIGGFTIGENALYNAETFSSLDATDETGVYLGVDGIKLGANFTITNEGVFKTALGDNYIEMFNGNLSSRYSDSNGSIYGAYLQLDKGPNEVASTATGYEFYHDIANLNPYELELGRVYFRNEIGTSQYYVRLSAESARLPSLTVLGDVKITNKTFNLDGSGTEEEGNLTLDGAITSGSTITSGGHIYIPNGSGLKSIDSAGTGNRNLIWLTSSNNLTIGGGSYPPNYIYLIPADGYYVKAYSSFRADGWLYATGGLLTNDKTGYADGIQGVDVSNNGRIYMTAGTDTDTGIYMYGAGGTSAGAYILYDDTNDYLTFNSATRYTFSSSVWSESYIYAGTRIYLPNGKAIKGMKSGYTTPTTDDSIALVHATDSGDGSGYANRVVVGGATTPGATEVRASSSVYIKCAGYTSDENRYALQFARLNWGTTDSPTYYGCLRPKADGLTHLGSGSYHFRSIYATNSTISTSDRNRKRNIKPLDERYIQVFDMLQECTYQMIDGDRIHTGYIAQDVEEALLQNGITSMDFAGLCKDVVTKSIGEEEVPQYNEDGTPMVIYGLRYEELGTLTAAKVRQVDRLMKAEIQSNITAHNAMFELIAELMERISEQQLQINNLTSLLAQK